jgi:HEAT repeat protein
MDEQELAGLVSQLTCDDVIQCQAARRSLVEKGSRAVPALVAALGSPKYWVHWEAAKALSQIGDPASIDALLETLEDEHYEMRWLAAEGLINIGQRALAPFLLALMQRADSLQFREQALHILHDMDKSEWTGEIKPVIAALEGPVPAVESPVAAKTALDAISKGRPGT